MEILYSPSTSWELEETCLDVIKGAAPPPTPTCFWHWWLWDVHQTLDADIPGHLQKSPRVGKGDSRQLFLPTVSCNPQQSWKQYPWVTCRSLQLLMAEVDYGIQVKVSSQRGLGEGRSVCRAVILRGGWDSSRQSLCE